MNVAFLLHLYQPAIQEEAVLRKVAAECYIPLIRTIRSHKDSKFTLDIPLSLLELMDRFGYADWIADVKSLVVRGQVELVGSAAYHPLLTRLLEEIVEQEIILNEYALGYYFGEHQGFEGEPSLMLKDLNGFFPPEMAVNASLVGQLASLGYSWVIVDEVSIPPYSKGNHLYKLSDISTEIVVRNKHLSDALSFKRDTDISGFISLLKNNSVIALDGEYFGHHFKEGISLLEDMLCEFTRLNIHTITVSDFISVTDVTSLDSLIDGTWGAPESNVSSATLYPYWESNDNKVQNFMWDLQNDLLREYSFSEFSLDIHSPAWLSQVSDENSQHFINIHKFLSSDKFWWCSNMSVGDSSKLYNADILRRYLDICDGIAGGPKTSSVRELL